MKLRIAREKLLQAFQTAATVAPTRSPKPVLQNVKLEVDEGVATLMATDLEVGIRIDLSGIESAAAGTVLLPTDRFGAILRECSGEQFLIESDGQSITIKAENSQFHLPAENPEEFPPIAKFAEEAYHKMPARFLRELIRRTVFATDTESSRYALGGVLFEMTESEVVAVGTDGRRLARQRGPAESVGGHETGDNTTVVPARAMTLMERALGGNADEVALAVRANEVLLRCGETTIYARLVEGRFPKWRDVFPKGDGMVSVELTVGRFYAAVRQAAIVTSDERRGVSFRFSEGKVSLAGHGAERGESHVEVPIAYEGDELSITLDPRYLGDFLKVLDDEATFAMKIRDGETAAVCETDDGYAYVIMPLAQEGGAASSGAK
jgi:DNA polymerase-3 subunit beta